MGSPTKYNQTNELNTLRTLKRQIEITEGHEQKHQTLTITNLPDKHLRYHLTKPNQQHKAPVLKQKMLPNQKDTTKWTKRTKTMNHILGITEYTCDITKS